MTSNHSIENGIEGKYCIGYQCVSHWCRLTQFSKDKSRNDGLSNKCKECVKRYKKSIDKETKYNSYKKYQQSIKGKITSKKARKKQREFAAKLIEDLKINGCAICGYNKCNSALSFHHVNQEEKKMKLEITYMYCNQDKIINEVNKCILLCENCHREIHNLERENKSKLDSNKGRYNRRKVYMEILKGNGCAICGYNKSIHALTLHHSNPEDKLFNVNASTFSLNNQQCIDEINKCIVLCSNCHREIHHKERNGGEEL